MDLKNIPTKKINKILRYSERVGTDIDPVCVQAAITDFCLNKCKNCDHHLRTDKKFIPVDKWIRFLKDHKQIESVAYLGGDMATYSKLNELMQYHVDSDTLFGIVTCGLFPEKTDMSLLAKAKWVRVSLDTVDEELYSKSRGGIHASDVIKSIHRCKDAGVNIEYEITVSKLTEPYVASVLYHALLNAINVEVHPMFGEEFSNDMLSVFDQIKGDFEIMGLDFSFFCYSNFQFKKCVAPYYQIYIDSDGDIYPCCASSGDLHVEKNKKNMGNISDWQAFLDNRRTHKKVYKACKDCCDNTTRINYVVEKYGSTKNFF